MIDMLFVSLEVSLAVLAVLAVSPLLMRRYSRKWRYWVWLLFAVRLMIPYRLELPAAPVSVSVPEIITVTTVTEEGAEPIPETAAEPGPRDKTGTVRTADETRRAIDVRSAGIFVWAAGAAAFFGVHTAAYMVFRRRVKPYLVHESEHVYRCARIESPVLVGFIKPMIILPEADYSDEEREIIVKHELTHWQRRDMWYKLVLLIANSVHWFNPIVYVMVRRANADLEYTCDDAVVRGSDAEYRKLYSMVILKTMGSVKRRNR
ncbi:MAG TPA: hypothetical protein IAA61_01935 [Candidatus Ornithomonoglobus merdipullorum]|uniref:Peptidase M56 domain-containing protein n=1 Tax=Candidatus Ornithomonoglobus merdipullorum TaxID=2840895 RepID=A0A9D1SED3_9FIRM|nr:hypothetical protein [Candidatus Ornithomonoglobus merdipullorum]